jgi:hypothetical protein
MIVPASARRRAMASTSSLRFEHFGEAHRTALFHFVAD